MRDGAGCECTANATTALIYRPDFDKLPPCPIYDPRPRFRSPPREASRDRIQVFLPQEPQSIEEQSYRARRSTYAMESMGHVRSFVEPELGGLAYLKDRRQPMTIVMIDHMDNGLAVGRWAQAEQRGSEHHPCEYRYARPSSLIAVPSQPRQLELVNVGTLTTELEGVLPAPLLHATRAVGAILDEKVDIDGFACYRYAGSCFQVAPNILVTAGHVANDLRSSSVRVVFNYDFAQGTVPISPQSGFQFSLNLDLPEGFDRSRFPCPSPDPVLEALYRLRARMHAGGDPEGHLIYSVSRVIQVSYVLDYALFEVERQDYSPADRLRKIELAIAFREIECRLSRTSIPCHLREEVFAKVGEEPSPTSVGPFDEGIPLAVLRGWPVEDKERLTWVGHPSGSPKRAGRGRVLEPNWSSIFNENENPSPVFSLGVRSTHGASGGPILDNDGFVRGLTSSGWDYDRDYRRYNRTFGVAIHSIMRSVHGDYLRELIRRVSPRPDSRDSCLFHWIAPPPAPAGSVGPLRAFPVESIAFRSRDGHLVVMSSVQDEAWFSYDLTRQFQDDGGSSPLPEAGTSISVVTDAFGEERLYYWATGGRLVECRRTVPASDAPSSVRQQYQWRWTFRVISTVVADFPRGIGEDRGEFIRAWYDGGQRAASATVPNLWDPEILTGSDPEILRGRTPLADLHGLPAGRG